MAEHAWNDHYVTGQLPWDTGIPESLLVAFIGSGVVSPGRALDIGAGTGTNARWLAAQGFDVLGVDVAPRAIELARTHSVGVDRCRFEVGDFLAAPPADAFDFVFDRGCFHLFDAPEDRARFAANVARVLAPGGAWLSILGSTEGLPRDHGPPRRSAREIADAIEPVLAIHELVATVFGDGMQPATAWRCVARPRTSPAQPSTWR